MATTTLAERMAIALEQAPELSQAGLARACKVKPPSVSSWFSGETKTLKAEPLLLAASYLKVHPRWLLDGVGPMRPTADEKRHGPRDAAGNAAEIGVVTNDVPLVSWVTAGNWSTAYDTYELGDVPERIGCPVARHGPRTFALRVSGESMHNPTGRYSYSDGDIIFVDPDRSPSSGDRVVARLDDVNRATFKQLVVEDDGRRLLKALNPEWSPRYVELTEDAVVVGVVIAMTRLEQ